MKTIKIILIALCVVYFSACTSNSPKADNQTNAANNAQISQVEDKNKTNSEVRNPTVETTPVQNSSANQPKTVREFFMLLPQKYFLLEGCEPQKDKDCQKAKNDYLKNYLDVEDTANGYLSGGCDGAQSCLDMALFKRPDGTYIVGLTTSAEMMDENYFLEYKDGKLIDASSRIVPQFSKKNMYELPRYGTTVKVFAKKVLEKGDDYEVTERGEKLYDLEWKDGKFSIKK